LPFKPASRRDEKEFQDARFAMRLSLALGIVMLLGKLTAYFLTRLPFFPMPPNR
jgi:hypothetical protein